MVRDPRSSCPLPHWYAVHWGGHGLVMGHNKHRGGTYRIEVGGARRRVSVSTVVPPLHHNSLGGDVGGGGGVRSSHEGRSRTASPSNKAVTRYCVGGRVYLSRGPRDESRSTPARRAHTAGRVCKSRTPGRCAAMSVSSGGGARSEMGLRVSGSRFMEKNAQE